MSIRQQHTESVRHAVEERGEVRKRSLRAELQDAESAREERPHLSDQPPRERRHERQGGQLHQRAPLLQTVCAHLSANNVVVFVRVHGLSQEVNIYTEKTEIAKTKIIYFYIQRMAAEGGSAHRAAR